MRVHVAPPVRRAKQHFELEQGWKGLLLFSPPNCVNLRTSCRARAGIRGNFLGPGFAKHTLTHRSKQVEKCTGTLVPRLCPTFSFFEASAIVNVDVSRRSFGA